MNNKEKVCPYCNETINSAASICKYCGARLPTRRARDLELLLTPSVLEIFHCPSCSKPTPKNTVPCLHCKHPFVVGAVG
ncbi:double zinc ribbon domain-containing protein [Sphingomonas faeni]|uniref:double zinc ribbon domain-containing protein n=1 Tax=Sphingomonas faeni TaxID=185950 RepID=UPI003D7FCDD5